MSNYSHFGKDNPSWKGGVSTTQTCRINECKDKVKSDSLCNKHYEMRRLYGRLNKLSHGELSRIFKGKHNSPLTEFKKGMKSWNKGLKGYSTGKHISEQHKEIIRQARSGEKSNWWMGGISFEPYSVDWGKTLRRSIRERDNYICQICSQYGNHVHHINYDKKNCNPTNLITLCKRCHAKTNVNREYWTNYFKGGEI